MDREVDDLPAYEPMRVSNAAQRRNPLSDDKRSSRRAQKKEALTLPVQKASAYTSPGYYIVDRYGSPQEGPFDTYSLAIANLNGRDGIQFMDQPQIAPLTEPFPPGMNTVFGSLKESSMSVSRESDLLSAMAKATPSEAKMIMAELEDIRRTARLQRQADLEWDAAGAIVSEVLTPVPTYSRHTAATDWMEDIPTTPESVNNEMLTHAALWYQKVPAEVKADREEFLIQAQGVARREASKHGESANDAYALFMDHVSRIHGLSHTANNETLLPWSAVVPPLPPQTPVGAPMLSPVVAVPGNPGQPQPLSNDHTHTDEFAFEGPSPEELGQAGQVNYFWPNQDATPEPNDDGALSGAQRGTGNAVDNRKTSAAATCPNCAEASMAPKGDKEECPSCGYSRNSKTAAEYQPGQNPNPSWPIGGGQVEPVPYPINDPAEVARASSRDNLAFWPNADATAEPNDDGADNYGGDYDAGDGTLVVGGSRKTASPRFTYQHTSYDEYLNRISAGAAHLSQEFFPGSAAASSPTASQATKVAGGGMAPSKLSEPQNVDDPTGANLGENPAVWADPHSDQVMKQWGGTSSLPIAPTPGFGSDAVAESFSHISDFPNTGPSEVPSTRAQNIKGNASIHVAADNDGDEDDRGYKTGDPKNQVGPGAQGFNPDQGMKAQSPQGQADADRAYTDAYSSGRPMNWTDTGENVLGTVPVEGYEYNADHPNGEMWPFEDHAPGDGAANVAGVPAPGVQTGIGWPQPQVTKSSQLEAFRARVHRS